MRNLFFLVALLIFFLSFGQDDKFQFTAGYGLFYNEFEVLNDVPNIDYTTPKIGKIFEFSVDYALNNDRFVGFGFAVTSNTSTVNNNVLFEEGIGLSFDNFRLEYENQFYDIHFRKEFKNHLHLTVGLFYYRYFSPNLGFNNLGTENSFIEFKNDIARGDDLGISIAADYFFPIKDYFEIGLRGRLFYSLVGVEGISLSPLLKFSF